MSGALSRPSTIKSQTLDIVIHTSLSPDNYKALHKPSGTLLKSCGTLTSKRTVGIAMKALVHHIFCLYLPIYWTSPWCMMRLRSERVVGLVQDSGFREPVQNPRPIRSDVGGSPWKYARPNRILGSTTRPTPRAEDQSNCHVTEPGVIWQTRAARPGCWISPQTAKP